MLKNLKFLIIISSISFLLFAQCGTGGRIQSPKTGGIFGKLNTSPISSIKDLQIKISTTNTILRLDENGNYYFNNVLPGIYDLDVTIPGFTKHILKNVVVKSDSITIVSTRQLRINDLEEDLTYGYARVKKISPLKYGSLSGHLYVATNVPSPNTTVFIEGTFWNTVTDSSGFFKIEGILPGQYHLFSTNYELMITNYPFIIYPDSTTNVKVELEHPNIE